MYCSLLIWHKSISTVFPMTVPFHSTKGSKYLPLGLCKGNVKESRRLTTLNVRSCHSVCCQWPNLTEIRARIGNYNHKFQWNIITHPCHNFQQGFSKHVKIWRWMTNHVIFSVDIIVDPCMEFDASLAILSLWRWFGCRRINHTTP